MSIFNSQSVITEQISEADLKAYIVGFDFGKYRYDDLTKVLMRAVVDFAFGFHTGILEKYTDVVLKEAAQSIYKIKDLCCSVFYKTQNTFTQVQITASIISVCRRDRPYSPPHKSSGWIKGASRKPSACTAEPMRGPAKCGGSSVA